MPALSRFGALLRLELLCLLRDRRALLLSVVLPMALFPALFFGMGRLQSYVHREERTMRLEVLVDVDALGLGVQEQVRRTLATPELGLNLLEVQLGSLDEARARLRDPQPAAAVLARAPTPGSAPRLTVLHDGASARGREAGRRLAEALGALHDRLSLERVTDRLEWDPAGALVPAELDVAAPEDEAGRGLAALLPLVLVVVFVSGASYAALGAFAEEREHGTLETLLLQPVPSAHLAGAKLLAVVVAGLIAVAGNALSFALCSRFGPESAELTAGGVPPSRILVALAVFLPTALLLGALLCLLAARARSFREGQHYIVPVLLLTAVLAAVSTRDSAVLGGALLLVPVTGPALALRDVLAGTAGAVPVLLTTLATLGFVGLLLPHASRALDPERVLRPAARAGNAARARDASATLAFAWVVVVAVYAVGSALQARALVPGLLATLVLLLGGPALLWGRRLARTSGASLGCVLALRRPHPAHLLAALLLTPALTRTAEALFSAQRSLLPLPRALDTESLTGPLAQLGPVGLVLLLALAPGILEELFFRGAVLFGLQRGARPGRVVFLQALLFGAVHASLYRFLPTAILGGTLAIVRLRAASLWPAVLLHVGYNAALVLELRGLWERHLPPFAPWVGAGLACLVLLVVPPRTGDAAGPSGPVPAENLRDRRAA